MVANDQKNQKDSEKSNKNNKNKSNKPLSSNFNSNLLSPIIRDGNLL